MYRFTKKCSFIYISTGFLFIFFSLNQSKELDKRMRRITNEIEKINNIHVYMSTCVLIRHVFGV